MDQTELNDQILRSSQLLEKEAIQDSFTLMESILKDHFAALDNGYKSTLNLYNNYLLLCRKLGKQKDGIALFEKIKDIAWKLNPIFHAAACLYLDQGSPDQAMEQVRNCWLYDTAFYWKKSVLTDPDLEALSGRSEFQALAGRRILRNTYATEVKDKIIGSCVKTVCPRKSERCDVSGEKIEKGAEVFEISWLFGEKSLVLPENFEGSELYGNYRNKFLKNSYSMEEFDVYGEIWHPVYKRLIRDFDLDRALDLIFHHPPIKQTPYWYMKGTGAPGEEFGRNMSTAHNTKEYWGFSDIPIVISILFKTGNKDVLLERMEELPKDSLLLLAMADDSRFQEKAADILKLPGLPEVLNLFRDKKKFTLRDMLDIIDFGRRNPGFTDLLACCLDRYQAHYIGYFRAGGEFSGFHQKNAQLCYFFVAEPGKHLFLYNLLTKNSFPTDQNSSLSYMEAYYYRAAVFYVLFNFPEKTSTWLEYMKYDVSYFPSGSPKGFINDTAKMVDLYKRSVQAVCTSGNLRGVIIKVVIVASQKGFFREGHYGSS